MLVGFLSVLYFLVAVFLILLILIQRGKGGMGLGSLGGGTQMLFGGSGGQDFFQKLTWILGAILIFGSLSIAMLKVHYYMQSGKYEYHRSVDRNTADLPASDL
ncbi:MAG TPA: preprotein translocase subunit SecG [Candidatus Babeliales bacterium]|nr:preprotein translocase subunit SecG [Candidatus Babeliales bacterium]